MTFPADPSCCPASPPRRLIYLAGDLGVWHGPLRRWIDGAARSDARDPQVVARVYDYQITRSQLERAVRERLWLDGKSADPLTPENRSAVRRAALDDLIDHELLRAKARSNTQTLAVSEAEITGRLQRFGGRFESPDEMAGAMKSQGIAGERDLRDRLAARIQQEKYVESRIGPLAHGHRRGGAAVV